MQVSRNALLPLLVAGLYGLLTLIVGGNTIVLSWPWVAIWQVGLFCPLVWWLVQIWQQKRIQGLGQGFDWISGLIIISFLLSSSLSQFPQQARWYSWAGLCYLAALYALVQWLTEPETEIQSRRCRLILLQGGLGFSLILLSLGLWLTQTLWPELARLRFIQQNYGIVLPFDFSELTLRNWYPLGHQNYVAGYLLLILPILISLSYLQRGWQRGMWAAGVLLGLVTLYTTSSRGGWFGLVLMLLTGFGILFIGQYSRLRTLHRLWLGGLGSGALILVLVLLFANNRLRTLVTALFSGQSGGELAYRIITGTAGWHMGLSRPWSGLGLGSVPLVYQKYHPTWAGREAELVYQLHSTPAQLWAELGIWGIAIPIAAIGLLLRLGWRWLRTVTPETPLPDRVSFWAISLSLLGYGFYSLTDYQLDLVAISGSLVINLAVLLSLVQPQSHAYPLSLQKVQALILAGLGLSLAILIWLFPIHRAWFLSSEGFTAADQKDYNTFLNRLTESHQLASWEPYYSYQLGWQLGELSFRTTPPEQRQALRTEGIRWFQQANIASPYQEFGSSNLGWLLVNRDATAATAAFVQSAELIPAKIGVFFGLGFSLLVQGKTDLAIAAMTLEALRHPQLISSPIWKSFPLKTIYPQLLQNLESQYSNLLVQSPQASSYWHQCRGALRWWRGDFAAARLDLADYGSPEAQLMLNLTQGQPLEETLRLVPNSPGVMAIRAWLNPDQRLRLLQQGWILANPTRAFLSGNLEASKPPEVLMQQFKQGMEQSGSFFEWVTQKSPENPTRLERLGFGALSRHVDGPPPKDFLPAIENLSITTFFRTLFPTTLYYPDLDQALQPLREALLKQVQ